MDSSHPFILNHGFFTFATPVRTPPSSINSRPMAGRTYVTTAQVCAAAGISAATALRWSKAGLLPPYERVHGGKRGQFARWPAHAAEQAVWVKAKLEALLNFAEIASMLAEGEFEKSQVISPKDLDEATEV